jgi:hypothetical protein
VFIRVHPWLNHALTAWLRVGPGALTGDYFNRLPASGVQAEHLITETPNTYATDETAKTQNRPRPSQPFTPTQAVRFFPFSFFLSGASG